ncbi:MAG TPA: peptidoglycan recognition family protein [Candidatus Deferrimicrobium sp.]|nr:peptidoglycan recognition family protein [Candidatus Deferrimicrobium sp.]
MKMHLFSRCILTALCGLSIIASIIAGSVVFPMKAATPKGERFVIIDYSKYLNCKFVKTKRLSSQYIIIHTSEGGLNSTLETLSRGKPLAGKYRTYGGHAHFAIARNGDVYQVLDTRYRADHAGLSMWNGLEDMSSHSLAIELVGFHYAEIADDQYRSLKLLVKMLQKKYHISDQNVLAHSQVSYGNPNPWHKRPHRGRKRCALNFDRSRTGLGKEVWTCDPDVEAGRLDQDLQLYSIFYKPYKNKEKVPDITIPLPPEPVVALSNIISKDNTAWNIAGEDYDSADTYYKLPDGREIRGDKIEIEVGWDRIPGGTQVILNRPGSLDGRKGPIFEISRDFTAWSYAGNVYNDASTFYFFAGGGVVSGTRVVDWDSLPLGTRMIIGYREPVEIQAVKGKTAWGIAGRAYNLKDTIYYIPDKQLLTGDQIKDFSNLSKGTQIFLKKQA